MTTLEEAARDAPEALRLADELIEQATCHLELAHCCDCRPEDTVNWSHYLQCGKAAAELRRLQAEVEALRGGWIPVAERLPEMPDTCAYELVLAFAPGMFAGRECQFCRGEPTPKFEIGEYVQGWNTAKRDQWFFIDSSTGAFINATHWQPLPTPPAQEDGNA